MEQLPVIVIGAGPQGLAAAAHLVERGQSVLVLEAGPAAGAAVSEWGHVRLFSAWPELVDAAAARLLTPSGWRSSDRGFPTGAEWVADYLAPLAAALGDRIRFGTRVTGVSRQGRDLLVDSGREMQPFEVHVTDEHGTEQRLAARAVVDASGTWATPNPAGAGGLPALGERAAREAGPVSSRIPGSADAAAHVGRHSVVLGSGHSAMTAVGVLARIARRDPSTRITWLRRRGFAGSPLGGGASDELAERGALGVRAQAAVDAGLVDLVTGFRTDRIELDGASAVLVAEDGRRTAPADHVAVLTGFRPDLGILSEVRLDLDPRMQAPSRIAAEIDPNLHSCGSVRATGARDLAHPERDLYIVGAKSYGRAPTFLAMTGYEQVRSIAAELAGDHEAASRIELSLPDTGVCGGAGDFDDATGSAATSCCAPPTTSGLLQIGTRQPAVTPS